MQAAVVHDFGLDPFRHHDPQYDQTLAVGVHANAVACGQLDLNELSFGIDSIVGGVRCIASSHTDGYSSDRLAR